MGHFQAIHRVRLGFLSVTNSATVSSITIDVNTTGFTAFQFPTSASFAGGASPAVCIPAGSGVVPL